MIRVEFFCDVCNPSHQRRDPGDEVTSGYVAREDGDSHELPEGWLVAVVPRTEMPGHVCPVHRSEVTHDASSARPRSSPNVSAGPTGGSWPAHTSPFGEARG